MHSQLRMPHIEAKLSRSICSSKHSIWTYRILINRSSRGRRQGNGLSRRSDISPIFQFEWGRTNGLMPGCFVRNLQGIKAIVAVILQRAHKSAQHVLQNSIDTLCLAIILRMRSTGHMLLNVADGLQMGNIALTPSADLSFRS